MTDMPTTIHDRLVASLKSLGAVDEKRATTKRYTVLRLDRRLARTPMGETETLEMVPTERARFWFVGLAGALRYVWERPAVTKTLAANDSTKNWLINHVPLKIRSKT